MASSVVATSRLTGAGAEILTLVVTGDSGDGSVDDYLLPVDVLNYLKENGYYLSQMKQIPGVVPMSAEFNVYVKDSLDYDILGGNGEDLIITAPEIVQPADGPQPIDDTALTLSISDQTDVSGEVTLQFNFAKY